MLELVIKHLKSTRESKLNPKIIKAKKEIENKKVYTSDGKHTLYDVAKAISDGVHPINLTIERNGKIIKLASIYPDEKGLIGIGLSSKQKMIETNTPTSIIKGSSKYLWDNTYMMVYSLGQLFTGNIPMKDMHGVEPHTLEHVHQDHNLFLLVLSLVLCLL